MPLKFLKNIFRCGQVIPQDALAKEIRAEARLKSEGGEQNAGVENDSHEISLRMSSSDSGDELSAACRTSARKRSNL